MLKLFAFITLWILLVSADQILIHSPCENTRYTANDEMDINYNVRYIGMIKIWTATTSLVHLESNTVIQEFPAVKWTPDLADNSYSVYGSWTIPEDIKSGNYAFIVSANATRPCSKNNDGKPPFLRCDTNLEERVTFTIDSV